MPTSPLIDRAPSAYAYPLLIKQLLHTPLAARPEQEIVYRDSKRYDYRDLARPHRPAGQRAARLGVGPGDTVAVMDWDSHRYLECYFAVPMMGAVLMTVNVRLSPEQILYTLEPFRARACCWSTPSSCRCSRRSADQLDERQDASSLQRRRRRSGRRAPLALSPASTRTCWPRRRAGLRVPRLRREHPRDHLLHHRHHRRAEGRVLQPPPAGAAHAGHDGRCWPAARASKDASSATTCTCRSRRCSMCTPGACRTWPRCSGSSRSIPGRYEPELLLESDQDARRSRSRTACRRILHMLLSTCPRPRTWTCAAGRS